MSLLLFFFESLQTGAKPYGCPDCGQKFAQRYNMMVHLRIHKGISRNVDKTHVCSICNIAFVRAQKLTEHYRKAHETIPHTTISGGTSATSPSTAASTSIVVEQMTWGCGEHLNANYVQISQKLYNNFYQNVSMQLKSRHAIIIS